MFARRRLWSLKRGLGLALLTGFHPVHLRFFCRCLTQRLLSIKHKVVRLNILLRTRRCFLRKCNRFCISLFPSQFGKLMIYSSAKHEHTYFPNLQGHWCYVTAETLWSAPLPCRKKRKANRLLMKVKSFRVGDRVQIELFQVQLTVRYFTVIRRSIVIDNKKKKNEKTDGWHWSG